MITIIDYGASNLRSVANALTKIGAAYSIVTSPRALENATKVIIPGVGAAGSAMQRLLETGFIEAIPRLTVPVLGICLGMQLCADFSEENMTQCLGIIPGKVKKFPAGQKIPQIGWNTVHVRQPSPLFQNIPDESFFYFVHSYYFDAPEACALAETDYGISFSSVVQKNNFYAVQFHPEKSGSAGLQLLRNFCELC